MKKILPILLFGLFLIATPAYAIPANYLEYLHVTALIDGSDDFQMTGNQWRWVHHAYSLPEISNGYFPTIVNGQQFLSVWDVPNGWYFYDIYSHYNTVSGLQSLSDVFGSDVTIELETLAGSAQLTQSPYQPGYTFSVLLDDSSRSGSSMYEFKIWGYGSKLEEPVVPEPSSLLLLGVGLLPMLRRKR